MASGPWPADNRLVLDSGGVVHHAHPRRQTPCPNCAINMPGPMRVITKEDAVASHKVACYRCFRPMYGGRRPRAKR